ncbi:hypothetical protein OGAPHI_000048 [Ogataea philodendri]|uniref:Uncharacterized protein n=1 Tax=Ogataea philodendri TaxID=1378263 RepID=A0A9P8PIF7_9ASCO|nr:uncharacterized protein OGAPHI_000048 [Ogataea philodendri]KAH3671862.1 hypothetical protein OGAPHI_000048 [Ogataea philodendri]
MFSLKSNVKSLESSPCLILSIKSDCDCRYSKYSSLDKSRPGSSIVDLFLICVGVSGGMETSESSLSTSMSLISSSTSVFIGLSLGFLSVAFFSTTGSAGSF